MNTSITQRNPIRIPILATTLPGPDRKRTPRRYLYRLTYRNPDPEAIGSVMVWEVKGGRLPYQVVIERQPTGELRSHCTCADAIYRADQPGHLCKHIRGFLLLGRTPQIPEENADRGAA